VLDGLSRRWGLDRRALVYIPGGWLHDRHGWR